MRRFLTPLVIAIAVWTASGSSLAQTSNTIMGTVFDTSRRPISDLWVEVLDEANEQLGKTRTDAVGRYTFSRLSPGTFLVRVASDGIHISQTQRVQLIPSAGSSGSHIETVDFYLKSYAETADTPERPAGFLFAQEVPEPARNAYQEAVQLLNTDLDAGLKKLDEAISIFPDYYAALARYGFELVKSGRYDPAIPLLTKAVQVNPKGQDSLYALGVAEYQLKMLPESAETLAKMVDLAPESPNASYARYYLGMALVKTGKPGQAEPHLRKAYERGGEQIPSDVHMALAQIYGNSKRYREAADQLELFLKEVPDARDKEKIQGLIKQLRAKAK
jgi:tetratricopeptide (TPR) repeat protein